MTYLMSQDNLKEREMVLGFKIMESTHVYNSVVNTMKTAGIKFVAPTSSKWNICWTGCIKPEQLKEVNKYQRLNHFPMSV